MWYIITAILFFTCSNAYQQPTNNPYPPYIIEDRARVTALSKQPRSFMTSYPTPQNILDQNEFIKAAHSDLQSRPVIPRQPFASYPTTAMTGHIGPNYLNNNYIPKIGSLLAGYLISNDIRQGQSAPKKRFLATEGFEFDADYGSGGGGSEITFTDSDSLTEPKKIVDTSSCVMKLALVENFGNYLKRRTSIDPQVSTSYNDAAHQYSALLAVLISLARVIRNSCAAFDQFYDQIYFQTVETYYKYGLANADKVTAMIEDYIQKGNSHMPKIIKLRQQVCEKEIHCSIAVDNLIKASPLIYVKELETLEALANLARSYLPFIEEFNEAAQKEAVLPYLQRSKERLKEYIMNVVNSVEHLTDKQVKCTTNDNKYYLKEADMLHARQK